MSSQSAHLNGDFSLFELIKAFKVRPRQLQINYLSQFLLTSEVMPMMTDSDDARVVMIGSVTGNDNTVGGGGVHLVQHFGPYLSSFALENAEISR